MTHAPAVEPEPPVEVSPMTHRSLTEACVRPPGTPPSRCRGDLTFVDSRTDVAQATDGLEVGAILAVDSYHCDHCGHTLVVSHARECWFLRNQYPSIL